MSTITTAQIIETIARKIDPVYRRSDLSGRVDISNSLVALLVWLGDADATEKTDPSAMDTLEDQESLGLSPVLANIVATAWARPDSRSHIPKVGPESRVTLGDSGSKPVLPEMPNKSIELPIPEGVTPEHLEALSQTDPHLQLRQDHLDLTLGRVQELLEVMGIYTMPDGIKSVLTELYVQIAAADFGKRIDQLGRDLSMGLVPE